MTRRTAGHARPQRNDTTASNLSRLLVLVAFVTAAWALARGFWKAGWATSEVGDLSSPVAVPTSTSPTPSASLPTTSSDLAPTATDVASLPIGIVAGHWGSDSGAICDGWLQEVDINLAIARRVVYTLRALGYPTDLLEEFDARLEGYQARALVSIHADSCLYPEASGFKATRVEDSAVPELEDRLVSCLVSRYQARTGLAFHEGSITTDMTHYHTFYEIDPRTPGAIVEVGFMLADRDLLLNRQDLVAQGIVEGILCFLQEEMP
jgi:N-acetylmuramoyl-L-alanine amidase